MTGVRPKITCALIGLVAFTVRVLHVLSYDPAPTNDMAVYVDMAVRRLALANLFSPEGICWFPPGYSLFMKPFFLLFERDAALRAIQIAQCALGAWTCLLVGRLATRLHSRRAGLVAALLTCFYPHLLFYSSAWMSENLFTPLYLVSILLVFRAARRDAGGGLYRAGLVTGAAAIVRPVAASVGLLAIVVARRRGRSLRALLPFLLGGLTIVGPLALRNRIAYGHFVAIAPNGAFNLAIGNQADATGHSMDPPSIAGDIWSRMDYFRQSATAFVTNDPWGALYVAMKLKWEAFWEAIPPWPLYSSDPQLFAGENFFPFATWQLAFALGLVGVGALALRRRADWWLTPLALAAYTAFYMLFFGGSRFRLPAETLFLAWAGCGAAALVATVPRLRRATAPQFALAISLGLVVALGSSAVHAASARAFLLAPASRLAAGDQMAVVAKGPPVPIFAARLPVDRSRGRYVRMGFTAYRQGPPRDVPDNGFVKITFYDADGNALGWLDNPKYYLEALPADRWVYIAFKAPIPPAATSCQVTLVPNRASPDTLILDQPILRYARGLDLAFEFEFPYLRYAE
ncbi:MAG: glycosyltransferase family 39 protein [Acidobacteria bacterium]|nr:glycosyltransferase family 39 protein [Acidobacteriota bacterium]